MQPIDHPSKTNDAAKLLWQCRREHSKLPALPPELTPRGLDEAYEIQEKTLNLIATPAAGYKLGLTSAAGQAAAGVGHPISGRVLADTVHPSPALIPTRVSAMRAVEAEVAVTLGAAFTPRSTPYTLAEVIAGIGHIAAAIEVCDSRFVDCDPLPIECIVADNANAAALVIGDRLASWTQTSLDDMPVTLLRNGEPAAEGNTRNVLGNPLNALVWLVNRASSRGVPLPAGQVVSTGTCTGVTLGAVGDHFEARFGGGARVELTFGS